MSQVGVAGDLEPDAGGLGDRDVIWSVGQQDAGAIAVDADLVEHRAEVLGVSRVAIRDADDLQAIDFRFFVIEDA